MTVSVLMTVMMVAFLITQHFFTTLNFSQLITMCPCLKARAFGGICVIHAIVGGIYKLFKMMVLCF